MLGANCALMLCGSFYKEAESDETTERSLGAMQDEIERSEWVAYFKEFSERNAARPTQLETFGELGAQEEEHGLPLAGVGVEMDGADSPRVEIMLGGLSATDERHLTHTVMRVRRIMSKLGADGREEALELEDSDGTQTLLRFEARAQLKASVASPEEQDPLAHRV
jgi:hypothetical protein